jgi:translation initiation factor 4E
VIKASQLAAGSNYHLFKEGVQPMWEDPANEKGGKWVAQLFKAKKADKDLDSLWLSTVRMMNNERKENETCINGGYCS